jgi:hypothetical protein
MNGSGERKKLQIDADLHRLKGGDPTCNKDAVSYLFNPCSSVANHTFGRIAETD